MTQKKDIGFLRNYQHGEAAFIDGEGYPFITPLDWRLDGDSGELRASPSELASQQGLSEGRCRLLFHSHDEKMEDLRQVQVVATVREQDRELLFTPLHVSETRFTLGLSLRNIGMIWNGKRRAAQYRKSHAAEILGRSSRVFEQINDLSEELKGLYLQAASQQLSGEARSELAKRIRETTLDVPEGRLDEERIGLERAVTVHNWLIAESVALSFLAKELGDDFPSRVLNPYANFLQQGEGLWDGFQALLTGLLRRIDRRLMPAKYLRTIVEKHMSILGRFHAKMVYSDSSTAKIRVTNCPVWSVRYLSNEQREMLCQTACRYLSDRSFEDAMGVEIVSARHDSRGCTKLIRKV